MLELLLSSRVRAKILTTFFLSPGVERNAWELAQSLGENYSAVWKELNRLEKIGILISQPKGNAKAYEVNENCSIAPELRSIVLKTQGIGKVLRDQLLSLGNVKRAFIYGSFASGAADIQSDVDVMIIGNINLEEISDVISKTERELNRPINYVIFTEQEWKEKLDNQVPFAINVDTSAKIMLIGGENAL